MAKDKKAMLATLAAKERAERDKALQASSARYKRAPTAAKMAAKAGSSGYGRKSAVEIIEAAENKRRAVVERNQQERKAALASTKAVRSVPAGGPAATLRPRRTPSNTPKSSKSRSRTPNPTAKAASGRAAAAAAPAGPMEAAAGLGTAETGAMSVASELADTADAADAADEPATLPLSPVEAGQGVALAMADLVKRDESCMDESAWGEADGTPALSAAHFVCLTARAGDPAASGVKASANASLLSTLAGMIAPDGRDHPKSPIRGIGDLGELEVMESTVETLVFQIAERKAELLASKPPSTDHPSALAPPSTPEVAAPVQPAAAVAPTEAQLPPAQDPELLGGLAGAGTATVSTASSELEPDPSAAAGVTSASGASAKARKERKVRDPSLDVKTTRSTQLREKARLAKQAQGSPTPGGTPSRKPRRPPSGSSGSHPRTSSASNIVTAQKRRARSRMAKKARLSSTPINHEDIDLELDAQDRHAKALIKKREALQRTFGTMQGTPPSSVAASNVAERKEEPEIDFADYGIGLTADQTAAREMAKVNVTAEFSHTDAGALATLPVASPGRIKASAIGFDLIKTWTDEFCGEIATSAVGAPPQSEPQRVVPHKAADATRAADEERKFNAALMAGRLDTMRIDREKAALALKRTAGASKVKSAQAAAEHQAAVTSCQASVSIALDGPAGSRPAAVDRVHTALNSAVPCAASQENGSNASSTPQLRLPPQLSSAGPALSTRQIGVPAQQRPTPSHERATVAFEDANGPPLVHLERKMEEQMAAPNVGSFARSEARASSVAVDEERLAKDNAAIAAAAANVKADEDRLAKEQADHAAAKASAEQERRAKEIADDAVRVAKEQEELAVANAKAAAERIAKEEAEENDRIRRDAEAKRVAAAAADEKAAIAAAAAKVKADEDRLVKEQADHAAAKASAEQERRAKEIADDAVRVAKEQEELAVANAKAAAERIAKEEAEENDRIRRDAEAKRVAAAAADEKADADRIRRGAGAKQTALAAAFDAKADDASVAAGLSHIDVPCIPRAAKPAAVAAARNEEMGRAEDQRASATEARMSRVVKLQETSASNAKANAKANAAAASTVHKVVPDDAPSPPALAPSLTAKFDKPKRAAARLPSKRASPLRDKAAAPAAVARRKGAPLATALAATAGFDSDNSVAGNSTDGQYEVSSDDSASDDSSIGDSKYSVSSDWDSDSVEDDDRSAPTMNTTQSWPGPSPGMIATQEWPVSDTDGILDKTVRDDDLRRTITSAKDIAGEAQKRLARMKSDRPAKTAQAGADHVTAEATATGKAAAAAGKAEAGRVAVEESANRRANADRIAREKEEAAKAHAKTERAAREKDQAAKREQDAKQLRERQRKDADERARVRAQNEKEAHEQKMRVQERARAAEAEAAAKLLAEEARLADEVAKRERDAIAEQMRQEEEANHKEEQRLHNEAVAAENHLRETAEAEAARKARILADEEASKQEQLRAAKEAAAARRAKIESDKAAKANRFNRGKGWSPTKPESSEVKSFEPASETPTEIELKPEPTTQRVPTAVANADAATFRSGTSNGGGSSDSSLDSSFDDDDGVTAQPDTDSDGDSF